MSLSPIVMLMLLRYRDALAFETFRLNVVVAVLLDEFISSISREKEAEKQIEEKEQQKRRITGVQLSFFVLFLVLLLPFCLSFSSFCLLLKEPPHHGVGWLWYSLTPCTPKGKPPGAHLLLCMPIILFIASFWRQRGQFVCVQLLICTL